MNLNQIWVAVNGLRAFIEGEMRVRDMSAREFAQFLEVGNSTINRLLDPTYDGEPSVHFLRQLALKTGTDIRTLISLVTPEATRMTATAARLAEEIEKLSPEDRAAMDAFILALKLKRTQG